MEFNGLGMHAGDRLRINHTNGLLDVKVNGSSVLDKRSIESSDEVFLKSGNSNYVTVSADNTILTNLYIRGRWY